MIQLSLNDEQNGVIHRWWINFVEDAFSKNKPLESYLREQGGELLVTCNENTYMTDTIRFEKEEELTWFLLKYS